MKPTYLTLRIIVAAAAVGAAVVALADQPWQGLHKEVAEGRIKSLASVLNTLESHYVGQVIEVEFEREDGESIYEIEMIGPAGQVVEFEIDAVSGEIIGMEGRNIEGMRRR